MKPFRAFLVILSLCVAAIAQADTKPELAGALDHFRAGRFAEAFTAYSALLPNCANCGPVHAGVIRSLLRQEKVEAAHQAAEKALATLPKDPEVQAALGELRFRQGRLADADVAFVAAANATPPVARAYLGLSRFYQAISKYQTAAKMIEKAHALDPADPEISSEWLYTQPRSARLAALKLFLAQPNNLDPLELEGMKHHIEFTEARSKHPEQRCRLVSKTDTAELQMQPLMDDPTHFHGYGIDVQVNGRKAALLLDTGASGITINRKMAEKAGVEVLTDTKVFGIGDNGAVRDSLANAKSIRIGGMEFEDCVVSVVDGSALDERGLIGADVFSNYLVTLDFPWQKLRLTPLPKRPENAVAETALSPGGAGENEDDADADDQPPVFHDRYTAPEMKDYSLAVRFGSHFFVPASVVNRSKNASGLFLVDTGASSNIVSSRFGAQVTKVHKDEDTILKGLNGKVKQVSSADDLEIHFAGLRQRLQDTISINLDSQSRFFGAEVSGILGFSTLHLLKVDLDYRDGLIRFTYDAK